MSANIVVQLKINEIYELLCDECKKKLEELIQTQISKRLVDQVIGKKKLPKE